MTKNCGDCKFCIFKDHGYSNYTVEGTDMYCAKDKHPEAPFDRFYGEDYRLEFAKNCPSFTEGTSIEMDVDEENYDGLSQEQKEIYYNAMW